MPVLAEETSMYPADLLDGIEVEPMEEDFRERRWLAIHTKARQEKSLARELLIHEIPFYLPLVSKRIVYRGRRVRSHLPLFTGYMFFFGSEGERLRALSTHRIAQILPVHDPECLVRDLQQLHRLIQSDSALTVESQLQPGRRVRIKAGPFLGLEGTVEARRGGYRFIVGVHFLQRGVSIDIDETALELIEDDSYEFAARGR